MRTVRDKLGSVHAQKWKYLPSGLRERCLFPRLGERATQAAGTMSGSEEQMLGIARALMASPKLIIVDELSLGTHVSEVARGAVEIGRERDVCLPPPLSAQHIGVLLDIVSDPLTPTTALGDRIDDRLRTAEIRGFNPRGSTSTALLSLLSVQRPFQRFPAKPRLTPGIAVDSRSHLSE